MRSFIACQVCAAFIDADPALDCESCGKTTHHECGRILWVKRKGCDQPHWICQHCFEECRRDGYA